MQSTGTGSDDGAPGGRDSNRVYFDSPGALESAFAGNLTGNLSAAEYALGVKFASRESWAAPVEDTPEHRGEGFLRELRRLQKERGRSLDQSEFDLALDAWREGREQDLGTYFAERVPVGAGKKDVSARSPNQLAYLRAMRSKDLVFGVGPAGTGKTYLAMAMAVSLLVSGQYNRIILTRPAVEAGENLGFLPGTLQEKINPYLRPLHDALREMMDYTAAEELMSRGVIEVAPLAFMRGRTLNHAFVILDEAQNASHEQMFMFLTRLGFHSKCVVCGDPSQADIPHGQSGLPHALDTLAGVDGVAVCRFDTRDVVRHPLVEKIIRAYRENPPHAKGA